MCRAEAEKLYSYNGSNPFRDSQGRNFSDIKIQQEFYPISKFWSLFNDHHEILIGARGSGKTFLLKMMRRSMLKTLRLEQAESIIKENNFFSFYVPMHMETISALIDERIDDERRLILFKYVFNSLLAESIVEELNSYLMEFPDETRAKKSLRLARDIGSVWYANSSLKDIFDVHDLGIKGRAISYNFDYYNGDINDLPVIFCRELAGPLHAIQPILNREFDNTNITWIVCVDEAEFIPEIFQKCFNSFMRSDTHGIAMKLATLPFYWRTLSTLEDNIYLSQENDFNYQILDLDCDSEDFIGLTNKLCSCRCGCIPDSGLNVHTLEDFLGRVGNDKRIDYYKDVMQTIYGKDEGEQKASSEQVIEDIIESFSPTRRKAAPNYQNVEKTIHQKFAPVLYTREIYKICHLPSRGRIIPGWYAGADIVRKVSQGNPRLFIRLMSNIFTRATEMKFSTKLQHQVVSRFAEEFCLTSQAIEVGGCYVYEYLSKTAEYIKEKVHGSELISVGNSFKYRYSSEEEFNIWREWLQRAVAYSRLTVPEKDVKTGLTKDTVYTFSNAYSALYWIPMRNDTPMAIPTTFSNNSKEVEGQLSLFEYNNV